ncbi:MAG: type I methionyl aminopeptidase [Candidatus Bostrichicola ureolyticus]|nr:MAG: type I methionyl aminopeptidase [Candidatus Bostrichicola ureolyticus]
MVYSVEEIELIRISALLTSKTLGMLAKEIKPGINTLYLDKLAKEFIYDNGGISAFLGLYDFPNTICISINEQVVHGIPKKNVYLYEGDIISIDCGVKMNGYCGDQAYTFEVGQINSKKKKLLQITKESLYLGIKECKKGHSIGHIGFAIQNNVEKYGYSIVREFVGHGIGRKIHENPQIPNYGKKGNGDLLKEGMVLAIEPMVNMGTDQIQFDKDGWTISTFDRQPSAHFEHNIAIINGKASLLSTFEYIYKSLIK